jgi:hypothetical protein
MKTLLFNLCVEIIVLKRKSERASEFFEARMMIEVNAY